MAAAAMAIPAVASLASKLFSMFAGGKASRQAQEGYLNAIHGTQGALGTGTRATEDALRRGVGRVDTATGAANTTLQEALTPQQENLAPYLATGGTAATNLQQYIQSAPKFSFTSGDLTQEPGYQFQLGQGQQTIENSASARGLLQSGNTLKELTQYGQGLAGTYYQNAFNRAKEAFQTNQDTTLANLKAGVDTGIRGSTLYNQATQNATNRQAENTFTGGVYGAQSDIDVAKFLANLNVGGSYRMGDWAVDKGNAAAGGTMAQGQAGGGVIQSAGDLLKYILSRRGGGGGGGGPDPGN